MSAAVETYRDDVEATYAVDFSRDREPSKKRARFPEYKRRGSAPSRVSGMHCRRNKRWTWGSGRGARVLNMRAFAGAIAFAVASVASSVLGVPMDMVVIGNPGNAGNPSSSPSGMGAVAEVFRMATKETSNSQYVQFLNSVDPFGSNPNGIYNPNMSSNALGGILFDSSAANGSKYSVKSGTRAGVPEATYANMPVNFVTWFSAARFVNWLENGMQSNPLMMEMGTYDLANATSGPIAARNPGATYFLPSADEWYKAAFFDGSAYTTYQTNSNTAPTASLNIALTNVGNFSGIAGGPIDVGAYVNTESAYGLYDMLGNINEMTDTASNSQFRAMGGGFNGIVDPWNATATPIFQNSTVSNQNFGFRVAAVPEPSTYALLAASAAGLGGVSWVKRRRRLAA
jgi:formylglycine-generating enzyme required for sulfatase activity